MSSMSINSLNAGDRINDERRSSRGDQANRGDGLKKFLTSIDLGQSLIACTAALLSMGLIAVTSASIEMAASEGSPFGYGIRHTVNLTVAMVLAFLVYRQPMHYWFRTGGYWLLLGFVMLALVLIPGIGREVNGSRRWLALGPLTLQCSEFVKMFVIIFMAGYLVRRQTEVQESFSGFVKPMGVLFCITGLLLAEPDFGATVVTVGTAFALLFIGGARIGQFIAIACAAVAGASLLVISAPYRMKRLTAFTDPWADQFNTGYQLTQSLIAFGRGEWLGLGLGNSVQKLFYLPEAHTDFVFAVWAEEFGFVGAVFVLMIFAVLISSILVLSRRAVAMKRWFEAYIAFGVAMLISFQVFINIGVASGLLPTKGLTLPFFSYGGSSLMLFCSLIAVLLRVNQELKAVKANAHTGVGDRA
jgi:cell division protein FtsW